MAPVNSCKARGARVCSSGEVLVMVYGVVDWNEITETAAQRTKKIHPGGESISTSIDVLHVDQNYTWDLIAKSTISTL